MKKHTAVGMYVSIIGYLNAQHLQMLNKKCAPMLNKKCAPIIEVCLLTRNCLKRVDSNSQIGARKKESIIQSWQRVL